MECESLVMKTFLAEASDAIAGGVELREGRECGIGARVAVGGEVRWQMNARGGDVGRARLEVAKVVIDAGGVAGDHAVTEIFRNAVHDGQLRLVPGREGGDFVLESCEIHDGVWLGVGAAAVRKDQVAADVVGGR